MLQGGAAGQRRSYPLQPTTPHKYDRLGKRPRRQIKTGLTTEFVGVAVAPVGVGTALTSRKHQNWREPVGAKKARRAVLCIRPKHADLQCFFIL